MEALRAIVGPRSVARASLCLACTPQCGVLASDDSRAKVRFFLLFPDDRAVSVTWHRACLVRVVCRITWRTSMTGTKPLFALALGAALSFLSAPAAAEETVVVGHE